MISWYDVLWELGKISGCHQMPERSFFIGKKQFPVCARCTGAFIGYLVGGFIYPVCQIPISVDLVFCLVMIFDWLIQRLKIRESTNLRRLFTGMLCAFGLIQIYLRLFVFASKRIISIFTLQIFR